MYKLHTECRACGYGKRLGPSGIKAAETGERLIEVFDLGVQPLANDFRKDGEEHSGYAPLKVLFCPRCTLAQLSVVVDPSILYSRYPYVTSPTETMRKHFQVLHEEISSQAPGGNLLEIGSNDGALLEFFKGRGYGVLEIDPAENLHELALARGVDSLCGLFSPRIAEIIHPIMRPDIILARHVFCHIDDWRGFVAGLEILAKPETLICIEVPYCKDTLAKVEWDTVYHEHLSYLTLKSIVALLAPSNLRLSGVRRYSIHGGAILLLIRRKDSMTPPSPEVEELVEGERIDPGTWVDFRNAAKVSQQELADHISFVVSAGSSVAALGASAKSTVWINACGFSRKEIRFIADSTPQKQYTTGPGADIPVVDEGALLRELPDYTICFAWNFIDEILRRNALYRSKGGKFIVPIPKMEVVNP